MRSIISIALKNIWTRGSLMLILLLLGSYCGYGQERVKASKGYMAGDTIYSPLYGIQLVLPAHWNGYLTRGTEIFTLNSDTTSETNIMIFPSEEDLKTIEARWNSNAELSPGLEIEPVGLAKMQGDKLAGEFKFVGDATQVGYSFASCGNYGSCYIAFLIVSSSSGKYYENALDKLSKYISFFEPTISDIYGDFDWANEVKGKYMITYESGGGNVKQNHLWLCEDGTFQARITRKGGLKGSTGKYKGKLKGTYSVEGLGSTGNILLNFEKLSPLELPLEIKEEVIFMNGLRYSVAEHNQCK